MDLSFLGSEQYLKIKYEIYTRYFNGKSKIYYLPTLLQFRRVKDKLSIDSFYIHVYFETPMTPNIGQLKNVKVKEFLVKYTVEDMKVNEIYFMPSNKEELRKLNLGLPNNHRFYNSTLFNYCEEKIQDYYIPLGETELYCFEKRYSLFNDEEINIYYIPIDSIYLVQRKDIFKLYHEIREKFNVDINMKRQVGYDNKGKYESMYFFAHEEVVNSLQL